MNTYEFAGEPFTEPRSHPWIGGSDGARYYDFRADPAAIRVALEEFSPFARYPAIEIFYALLERLNHPQSPFESNDCSFSGAEANANARFKKALECSGRVMILFRELELNTSEASVEWLQSKLHQALHELDATFRWGVVGTTRVPVRYLALPSELPGQLGQQIMISFWAFGDSEDECMRNLARLLKNLDRGLRIVDKDLRADLLSR
jgi:hypothetical protein